MQDGENVTIVDNGIKIEAQDTTDLDNKIYQCIESVPHNVPLTFSAMIDNKLYIVQGMSFTRIQNTVNDFVGVEIGEANGYQYALIRNTQGSITIQAVKLERGFLSTLARKDESGNWILNDAPPNFQQELAKCQRYFLKLTGYAWVGSGQIDNGEKDGQFFIPTPVSMRALPTCSGNLRIYNGSNDMEVDIMGISGYNENGANGAFTLSGFNNSSGSSVSIWSNTGESFALSADL